jgi:hypothetical protein
MCDKLLKEFIDMITTVCNKSIINNQKNIFNYQMLNVEITIPLNEFKNNNLLFEECEKIRNKFIEIEICTLGIINEMPKYVYNDEIENNIDDDSNSVCDTIIDFDFDSDYESDLDNDYKQTSPSFIERLNDVNQNFVLSLNIINKSYPCYFTNKFMSVSKMIKILTKTLLLDNPSIYTENLTLANKKSINLHNKCVYIINHILYMDIFTIFKKCKNINYIIKIICKFCNEHNNLMNIRLSKSKKHNIKLNKKLKQNYNNATKLIIDLMMNISPLNNILLINEQLEYVNKKSISSNKIYDDFNNPFDKISFEKLMLQTNDNGKTNFDNSSECLDFLRISLDNCVTYEDLDIITENEMLKSSYGCYEIDLNDTKSYFILKIKFKNIDNKNYWLYSNSTKLMHILCNGKPPNLNRQSLKKGLLSETSLEFIHLYPYYSEFLKLLKKQITFIIKNSYTLQSCKYVLTDCCRINPICMGKTLSLKESNTKLITCIECNLDLCVLGCGRIYHGETDCNISFDEASEQLINSTSIPCPKCHINTHKFDGCNHMTCYCCNTQFCWICGEELPKDINSVYRTELHFRSSGIGPGIQNGCFQNI